MNKPVITEIGAYKGVIADAYRSEELLRALEGVKDLVANASDVVSEGRNRNVRLVIGGHELLVKSFGSQGVIKDRIDKERGSKAGRTWQAAQYLLGKGVGTPEPVGFLERWEKGRIVESYYLSIYQTAVSDFKDELIHLFKGSKECEHFMALLQCVADEVRSMHEAGFMHNDLGNQNILLRQQGSSKWSDVQFIDLNRGREKTLSLRNRARDISRLYLPSDLLRVFKEMYFQDVVPAEFQKWEKHYRSRYAWHSRTRSIRHPLRTLFQLSAFSHQPSSLEYPSEKDMWIWDERSSQAISALTSKNRKKYYPLLDMFRVSFRAIVSVPAVIREYRAMLAACYSKELYIKDRVGMAVEIRNENAEQIFELLERLGKIPLLIRFYHHETKDQWDLLISLVKTLHKSGHRVSIALVQDRSAVNDIESWKSFADHILDGVETYVDFVECCHAVNRVKWGIWGINEHKRLLAAIGELACKYKSIKFAGPAVIDFEYPFLIAALGNVPETMRFSALSHHLYVDRRGAPENKQAGFSALKKMALFRAVSSWSRKCDEGLIISEVNWPLRGTGVYSPVGSPYESPGERENDPSVDEDDYAEFMLRYVVIAVCSGMAERVYWWRLAARGYGLVDDAEPEQLRERPAYRMLKFFLETLGEGNFECRLVDVDCDVEFSYLMMFRVRKHRICLAWTCKDTEVDVDIPFEVSKCLDAYGKVIKHDRNTVQLTGSPVYLFCNEET